MGYDDRTGTRLFWPYKKLERGIKVNLLDGTRGFESDNCSSVHPRIMRALEEVNVGHVSGYGYDPITTYADKIFDQLFEQHVEVFYTFNGTGTNAASLAHLSCAPYAIICADNAHINSAETGAIERMLSGKVIGLRSEGGIIDPETLKEYMEGWMSEHVTIPSVLSLTQVTDGGFVYKQSQIKELCDIAHAHNMVVHMDGARLANAVAANNDDLIGTTCGAGVDVLSFGGTKNGFMFGEAVVFFDTEKAKYFKNTRKSCGQLPSKMRYIAAQFIEALKDGLWLEMAHHSNEMALFMYEKMKKLSCFKTPYKPQANELFAFVDEKIKWDLIKKFPFNNFGPEAGISRFVTSFDTTEDDVMRFVDYAMKLYEE